MNTFTAQELADFYQQVADGGEIEEQDHICGWSGTLKSPNLTSNPEIWRIKPKKKVVDLSVLVASQIDCEFRDHGGDDGSWHIYKLNVVSEDGYQADYYVWDECQPRMNHVHYWGGGECPLPEGIVVRLYFRDEVPIDDEIHEGYNWVHCGTSNDIIGFEVLGLADGWEYPWSQGSE